MTERMTSPLRDATGAAEPAVDADGDLLLRSYHLVVTARAVDELLWLLSRQGRANFVLTSRGHEVAQVASALALRPGQDSTWLDYRDLAAGLALGVTPWRHLGCASGYRSAGLLGWRGDCPHGAASHAGRRRLPPVPGPRPRPRRRTSWPAGP